MKATRGRERTPKLRETELVGAYISHEVRCVLASLLMATFAVRSESPTSSEKGIVGTLRRLASRRAGKPLPRFRRRLLRACPSRCSSNAFFTGFLSIAHRIYFAAGVVGLCRRGARPEVGEHLCVGALSAGGAIEFCQ